MPALICGSLAFDTITTFPGRFGQQILPDQLHILNVSFLVPDLRREFGGCAGNIAYNLKKIGGDPLIMATIGKDADAYVQRMDQLGLSRDAVRQLDEAMTAQAFITTDLDDNQITAFHPGAMNQSHLNQILASHSASLAAYKDLYRVALDGGLGNGLKMVQVRLGPARLTHCMRWLGWSKRCMEIAQEYVNRREGFGIRLADRESVQMKLGELISPPGVVPVVIKSLVFPTSSALGKVETAGKG